MTEFNPLGIPPCPLCGKIPEPIGYHICQNISHVSDNSHEKVLEHFENLKPADIDRMLKVPDTTYDQKVTDIVSYRAGLKRALEICDLEIEMETDERRSEAELNSLRALKQLIQDEIQIENGLVKPHENQDS